MCGELSLAMSIATGLPVNSKLGVGPGIGHVSARNPQQKIDTLGTVEYWRNKRQPKKKKKERFDAIFRPFAGYVMNYETLRPRWDDSALLKPGGLRFPENYE